jgi:hypothetical protein
LLDEKLSFNLSINKQNLKKVFLTYLTYRSEAMSHFHAQLSVNQTPIWEAQGGDYMTLQIRLLSQLETERTGAVGRIEEKTTQAIVFRCRKVATD